MTPLAQIIRDRIAGEGPMRLDTYFGLCLGHPECGYYRTRDPLGRQGDFVTSPEISQMFGEMLGAWVAAVWIEMGRPTPFILAELGPGRGTLMRDLLRVAGRAPGLAPAARMWLVEMSPVLRQVQARALRGTVTGAGPFWTERVEMIPPGPLILVANEFFDALPIRQFQRADAFWREREVVLGAEDGLALAWGAPRPDADLDRAFAGVADGVVVEVSAIAAAIAARLGRRIAAGNGAALVIDYGIWDGTGDTLQALHDHAFADPLANPGAADLTAHVHFRALAEAAVPARAWGPVGQGPFLERLGIRERAAALAEGKDADTAGAIAAALRRLTDPGEMGNLFQAMALTAPGAPAPPGLEG